MKKKFPFGKEYSAKDDCCFTEGAPLCPSHHQ